MLKKLYAASLSVLYFIHAHVFSQSTDSGNGYITSHEAPLPLSIKSIPLNKCWEIKDAWGLYFLLEIFCVVIWNFFPLQCRFSPILSTVYELRKSQFFLMMLRREGTFLSCYGMIEVLSFFWVCETSPSGTALSSYVGPARSWGLSICIPHSAKSGLFGG